MDLATRLRTAIDALGQTQSWVAARANLPEETISRIVTRNSKNPQVGTLLKLAPVLGVTVGWLVGEKSAPLTEFESRTLAEAIQILRSRLSGNALDPRSAPNAVPVAKSPAATRQQKHGGALENWPDLLTLPVREIPSEYAARGATWICRAVGDSMIGSGILSGDRLYVRAVDDLRQAIGDIAVCRVSGTLFVKRLEIAENQIWLASANDAYETMRIDETADDFAVLGVVIGRQGDL